MSFKYTDKIFLINYLIHRKSKISETSIIFLNYFMTRYFGISHGTAGNYFYLSAKKFDMSCTHQIPSSLNFLSFQWSSCVTDQLYGQHFTDAVSFPVANTLKIFYRGLRTMYLSRHWKIFSGIFLQYHTAARGWIYFLFLAYISCIIYGGWQGRGVAEGGAGSYF